MDVVALPTYREGFSNVALEAAAMALPIVASRVPGCVDAIEDGVTGTLVPARDSAELSRALVRYLEHPELRSRHGAAARERVLAEFRPEQIWEAIAAEYRALLAERAPRRAVAPVSGLSEPGEAAKSGKPGPVAL
jgi:glycosyltransferase involved in cell wall biosynthesis